MPDDIMRYPQCFSQYDQGDDVCDGDPSNPEDAPCAWRNDCSAFRCHMEGTGAAFKDFGRLVEVPGLKGKVEKVFRPHDVEEFAATIEALVEHHQPVDGVITVERPFGSIQAEEVESDTAEEQQFAAEQAAEEGEQTEAQHQVKATRKSKGKLRPKKRRKPNRRARIMARRALIRAARERHAKLVMELKEFKQILTEKLGMGYNWASEASVIPPGRFYVKDRLDTSGYASVYCRTANGRDKALAMLRFKPRNLEVVIALPLTPEDVSKKAASSLELKPYNDGCFTSISKKLDHAGIGLAAEVIAMAVKAGKIELPEPRRPYGWKP